jgi:hypothetical protein
MLSITVSGPLEMLYGSAVTLWTGFFDYLNVKRLYKGK